MPFPFRAWRRAGRWLLPALLAALAVPGCALLDNKQREWVFQPSNRTWGTGLAAAEGIEFLRPLASSAPLEQAHALLRAQVARIATDRYMAPEIERAAALVRTGALSRVFKAIAGLPALWIAA